MTSKNKIKEFSSNIWESTVNVPHNHAEVGYNWIGNSRVDGITSKSVFWDLLKCKGRKAQYG